MESINNQIYDQFPQDEDYNNEVELKAWDILYLTLVKGIVLTMTAQTLNQFALSDIW